MGAKQSSVQKSEPWDKAAPYILQGLDSAQAAYGQGKFQVSPWEGPVLANESPALKNARQGILQNSKDQTQQLAQAQGTVANIAQSGGQATQPFNRAIHGAINAGPTGAFQNAIRGNMNGGNAAGFDRVVNNMTGDGYTNQMRNNLRTATQEGIMPGINSTFAGSGMTGSSLHAQNLAKGMSSGMAQTEANFTNRAQDRQLTAANMAQGAHNTNLQRQMAAGQASNAAQMQRQGMRLNAGQMAQNQANQGQQVQLQAAGMMPQMSSASYNPYQQAGQVGLDRTNRAQANLQNQILLHQQRQTAPLDAINNYLNLTSNLGGQFNTTSGSQSQNPGAMGMLGMGLQAIPLLGALSDIRAKENIRKVGALDSGPGVYVYNYKGDDTPQIGVMAQEVEQYIPEAVSTRPDGLKQVHYEVM